MNVIVSNIQKDKLESLECDVIKNISGEYSSNEIIEMFKDFFYNKIIIDVTSLKNYKEIRTYEELVSGLDPSKIIFFLPSKSDLCKSSFLSNLITLGIYNFTPDIEGINYLIKKSNTLEDVKNIVKMDENNQQNNNNSNMNNESNNNSNNNQMSLSQNNSPTIIGIKNITNNAGATTLVYMLKKELNTIYGKDNVICIEVGKEDFQDLNEENMFSVFEDNLQNIIMNNQNKKIILIDLNNCNNLNLCNKIYYLMEPSTLRLNNLMRRNSTILNDLKDKEILLNKSMLNNKDVEEFEKESQIKIFYNIPPLDERKRNQIINELLIKMGLLGGGSKGNNSKIFGLFRR